MQKPDAQPLRSLPVDLSEIDELASVNESEFMDMALRGYVDVETGAVHAVFLNALRCVDGDIEAEALEVEEAEQLELAAEIKADGSGRYQRIPTWESAEDYEMMEAFARASRNPALQNALLDALRGRRPFRRFKDTLEGWPEAREAWFAYRDHVHRESIREWLSTLGIDPVDTSSHTQPLHSSW